MAIFLGIVFGFPTFVYTGLLALVMLYWLVSLTGLLGADALDQLLLGDADAVDASGLSALLNKIGLGRIPLTIIFSLLVLASWALCFTGSRLFMPATDLVWIRFIAGLVIFCAALVGGFFVTVVLLRPLRLLLRHVPSEGAPVVILGRSGLVRTGRVTADFGQALIEDGGAGLLIQVRSHSGELARGSKVVVIEHLVEAGAWLVVSEEEFLNGDGYFV